MLMPVFELVLRGFDPATLIPNLIPNLINDGLCLALGFAVSRLKGLGCR